MKIERLMLDGLEYYDLRLKGWMGDKLANAGAFRNWKHTDKAGAVTCWPVGNTALEPEVEFLFTETPPASGTKGPDNPSTISGVSGFYLGLHGKELEGAEISFSKYQTTYTASVDDDGWATVTVQNSSPSDYGWMYCRFGANKVNEIDLSKSYTAVVELDILEAPTSGAWHFHFTCERSSLLVADSDVHYTASQVIYRQLEECTNRTSDSFIYIFRIQLGPDSRAKFKIRLHLLETSEINDHVLETMSLGSTYYGGTLDVSTGVMTVTWAQKIFDGTVNWGVDSEHSTVEKNVFYTSTMPATAISPLPVCSHFPYGGNGGDFPVYTLNTFARWETGRAFFTVSSNDIADAAAMKTWVASQYSAGTPLAVVYPLASPITVQLTPTEILSLIQQDKYTPRLNTVYTDASSVQVGYRKSPIRDYYEKTQAIIAQGGEV